MPYGMSDCLLKIGVQTVMDSTQTWIDVHHNLYVYKVEDFIELNYAYVLIGAAVCRNCFE
jgi:hypothetical protein